MTEQRRTGFKIVDGRTGQRVTSVTYFSEQGARDDITSWQNRHDRGGRPDITKDLLLNMTVVEDARADAG
ncbi:hypothetical protein [Curtobacterium sp. MCBA15_004]|uniref:hypothetical protein n=1 Tax=Curtobacterium sp. MCBA15_004 TaxID=1898733 RepID=UPI0008DC6C4A|nr:hypothetical protein [Curtobacterium sp. MCBA15_004]WIA95818.1 hypothetical protein QOL16_11935 [Curtobacterium sp. MCBA15_004]